MIVKEELNFNREGDPLRKMGIGKIEGFRIKYNKKPFIQIIADLDRNKNYSSPNKLTYIFHLFYEKDYRGINDSIYFFKEQLFYFNTKEEVSFSIMNNKPEYLFEYGDEERTMWNYQKYPDLFPKLVIDPFFEREYEKLLDDLVNEWFDEEHGIKNYINKWILTGNYKIKDMKFVGL
jgi:hypothetical protein